VGGRFSPRLIVGAALIALVALVVVIGRLVPHGRSNPVTISQNRATSAAPTGDQSPAGAPSADPLLHKPAPPSTPPGADPPETIAKQFTLAWLHHDGVNAQAWLTGLAPYASADLRSQLAGVDPANVPASRLTNTIEITDDTAIDCMAEVPTDAGVLGLSLQLTSGRWLVTGIDWDQS
jgi:hypothetical protein